MKTSVVNPSRSNIPLFGIALIVVGSFILLGKFHLVHVGFGSIFWPIIMVFGLVGVGRGFAQNKRGKIFWNTVWFLYGLFFFLRVSNLAEAQSYMFVPATFLIIGIAFLMTFMNNIHDWFFLIPSLIFGGIGLMFIFAELDYVSYWDVADSVRMYWPVVLILFGLTILFRRRARADSGPPPS